MLNVGKPTNEMTFTPSSMTMRKFIEQGAQCTYNVTLHHVRVGPETQQYVPFVLLLTYT
jgi:hypothetical protein